MSCGGNDVPRVVGRQPQWTPPEEVSEPGMEKMEDMKEAFLPHLLTVSYQPRARGLR